MTRPCVPVASAQFRKAHRFALNAEQRSASLLRKAPFQSLGQESAHPATK